MKEWKEEVNGCMQHTKGCEGGMNVYECEMMRRGVKEGIRRINKRMKRAKEWMQ
jgi:hypothetical protein